MHIPQKFLPRSRQKLLRSAPGQSFPAVAVMPLAAKVLKKMMVNMAADAMVEDVNYTMITDVQIAERTKATVTTDNVAALRQGTSGAKIQTSTETGNQHKYQTRVVSNANKVNLKFEEAKPVLEDQLAKSIANIL